MSNAALSWAFNLPITGVRKAVLLALAEHANESGKCWPSVARLVLFSGVQDRAVRMALEAFEQHGLVTSERPKGRPAIFTLNLSAAWDAGLNKPREPKRRSKNTPGQASLPLVNAKTTASHATLPGIPCQGMVDTPRHPMPDTSASHATTLASHAKNPGIPCQQTLKEPLRTPKEPSEVVARKPRAETGGGCRLPNNWDPGDAGASFASELGLDPRSTFVQFSDYWRGKPGKDGRKADWPATWRNWCRNEIKFHGNGSVKTTGTDPWSRFVDPLQDETTIDGDCYEQ